MKLSPFTVVLSACSLPTPPTSDRSLFTSHIGRRALSIGLPAAAIAAALPQTASADLGLSIGTEGITVNALKSDPPDDTWTQHTGPFTDEFFATFETSKAAPDFRYKFIKKGEPGGEKPAQGQSVSINYRGYLLDGSLVDSSYGRGKPFKFRVGKGKVITGWEGIVTGMTPGMRVIVRIPPQYAYGEKGAGDKVPPNSVMVFYMELVELGDIKA